VEAKLMKKTLIIALVLLLTGIGVGVMLIEGDQKAIVVADEILPGTAVVINEIMYNPPWNSQANMTDEWYEWIELYNPTATDVDLSGYTITAQKMEYSYSIPEGITIETGGYLIIASDIRAFTGDIDYGWEVNCPVVGEEGNDTPILSNTRDTIRIYNGQDELIDEVSYIDRGEWPVAADGTGRTLELLNPAENNALAIWWRPSLEREQLGTPGMINSILSGDVTWQATAEVTPATVVAMERLEQFAMEVTNREDETLNAIRLSIPKSWPWSGKIEDIEVSASDAEIAISGDGTWARPYRINITGIELTKDENITCSLQRLVANPESKGNNTFGLDGSIGGEWRPLAEQVEVVVGAPQQLASHLVINEVYYYGGDAARPNTTGTFCDWVELYNPTENPICVDGWYVMDALPQQVFDPDHPKEGALKIPNPTEEEDYVVAPGGYFLIAFDEMNYRTEFPDAAAPDVEGNLDFRSENSAGQRVLDPDKDGPAPNCTFHGSIGLSKNRDDLVLYDGEEIIDAVAWGNGSSFNMLTSEGLKSPYGFSLARKVDGEEAQEDRGPLSELVGNSFNANSYPTPGASNNQ